MFKTAPARSVLAIAIRRFCALRSLAHGRRGPKKRRSHQSG
jgi:hypothetical protein